MRRTFFLFICWIGSVFTSLAQQTPHITGIVQSGQQTPVEFANVVMKSAKDSLFLSGCITDREGKFSMPLGEHSPDRILIEISCLGYDSKILTVDQPQLGIIVMNESAQVLDEVVISARRSPYTMKAGSLMANINNSPLKDAGNATDVLKSLPLLNVRNDNIEVFGKGTPLIYINNREVRSNEELAQLNSSQIKNIEVITSPGARYPASVSAVIRITTLKREDEGWSGAVYTKLEKKRQWNESALANLNYTTNKLDLFGNFAVWDSRTRNWQDNVTTVTDHHFHKVAGRTELDLNNLRYRTGLGLNYDLNPDHSLGVKYDFSWMGKSNYDIRSTLSYEKDGIYQTDLNNTGDYRPDGENGYLNAFYSGRAGEFRIHLNADYAHGNSSTDALFTTVYPENIVELTGSYSNSRYNLAAVKLDINRQIGKGQLEFGGEYSYTHNKTSYQNDNEELQQDLPQRHTKNTQDLLALFIAYQYTHNHFSAYAGVRYEHLGFDYYLDRIKNQEQSKTYDHVFPTGTLSYSLLDRKINMSLSYRRTTNRPSYYQLRGDIQYNSPFSYEGGNPALKNSFVNDLNYTLSYGNLYLLSSFKFIKDNSFFIIRQFEPDSPVTLSTFMSVEDYKQINLSVVWDPTFFKIWNPGITLGFQKQFLSTEYQGQTQRYNTPYVYVSLYNVLRLPKQFVCVVQGEYQKGHHGGFSKDQANSYVDVRLQKRLLNNSLTLVLGADNVFNTYREKWDMFYENVHYYKSANNDNRSVYVSVRYNFNKMKTYKGKGAAESERIRLGSF
ncbi:MAG: TonB-dependent receptor [Bacteroides sp.]|nr:TonB-dependent receptor [Bacteroides sp.]